MGPWRYVIYIAIIAFLGWGVYDVLVEKGNVSADADALHAELSSLESENKQLESDITFYESPDNLVKALKEQFNYRAPDEKLIILVSPSTSTTSSTQQ